MAAPVLISSSYPTIHIVMLFMIHFLVALCTPPARPELHLRFTLHTDEETRRSRPVPGSAHRYGTPGRWSQGHGAPHMGRFRRVSA